MQGCHFSRGLLVTQSEAYKYYRDIEKYPERYPRYYQNIDVIARTNDTLTVRMFLNVNLSIQQDHANITAKYTLVPEKEIKYVIVDGPGKGIIKNSIIVKDQNTVGDKTYKSAVEVNHIPLDLMCYPPPYFHGHYPEKYKHYIFSPEGEREDEYDRMITYFLEQDLVPLESKNWGGFKIGDLCNKCKKGHLQRIGKREDTGTRQTDFLWCDYCASEFKNYRINASDSVNFKG